VPFTGDALTMLRQRIIGDVPELPTTIAGDVHPRIANLLRCLLAKVPDNRVSSAAELLVDIDDCLGAVQPHSPAPPPSVGSVPGMTTPVGQRVRRTMVVAAKSIESEARRAIADPRSLLRHATRRNLTITAIGVAFLLVLTIAMVAGGSTPTNKSHAGAPAASLSGSSASEDQPAPSALTDKPQSVDDVPFLPPPPSPTSTSPSAKPSPSGSSSRHNTGPGGIYIPPPSTWFK
jgi:hypothetical protein